MIELAQIVQKYALKMVIPFKMVYSCCYKKFYVMDYKNPY